MVLALEFLSVEVCGQGLRGKKWSQKEMAFYLYACGLSSGVPGYIMAKSLELGQDFFPLIKGFLLCFFTYTVTAFAMKRQYHSGQMLHKSVLHCCDRTHRYSLLVNSLDCTRTVEAAM